MTALYKIIKIYSLEMAIACWFLSQNIVPLYSECGMVQLVARRAHNPKVVGSSPAPATKSD